VSSSYIYIYVYAQTTYYLLLAYSKQPCISYIVWCHSSRTFYILLCVIWLVTVSSDVTCCVTAWPCHSNPNPSSKNRIKENKLKRKENKNKNRKILSLLLSFLTPKFFQTPLGLWHHVMWLPNYVPFLSRCRLIILLSIS